ncbi:MAG TPA: DUF885 domain-containing protein, partial [Acidimicrobiia bacterium]|nr:DUF885 domain-containing protein [Acidimicrobiia bacterium]
MSDACADLRAAADRYWEALLEAHPTDATLHGDHRYDDRIEDVSVDAEARQRATWLELRAAVDNIDPAGLDAAGRVTQQLLQAELADAVEAIDVREIELRYDQNTAFHAELFVTAPQIKAPTPEAAQALLERNRKLPTLLGQVIDRLRAGLAAGRTPARINIERSLNQLDKYLASPVLSSSSSTGDPFTRFGGPPGWSGEAAWRAALVDVVRDAIRPAFARYRQFFADELLPAGRPHEQAGLHWLAEGEALYDHFVRRHTTLGGSRRPDRGDTPRPPGLGGSRSPDRGDTPRPPGVDDLTAEEIHRIGLDELGRLAGEYAEVGGRLFATTDSAEIFHHLRSDEALRYTSGDDIMADARRYLAAATAAMGAWFGRLPTTPCEITAIPSAIAEDMPMAYYFPPADDGSRP